MTENEKWEYGFYDDGDSTQTIWWYVFGLPHTTPESALHTAEKNAWGRPVIVRRHPGTTEFEVVSS